MRQKITNHLRVYVDKAEFTTCQNIEFYVKQEPNGYFKEYSLGSGITVVDDTHILVRIPQEDVMNLLDNKMVKMQCAYTDADGEDYSVDVVKITAKEFLKEAGYR